MKATYAYLAVLAVPFVVACAGGSGTVDFDGITGNEPTRSGLDGVPTTGNEAAPATVGETPARAPAEEEEEEDTPRPDAGTPSGGCSGSYTCVIAGDPVEFPLVSKGGKCTANGLTLEDGVVFDANNDPIGTFSAGSMTIQGTVCPRSK